MLCSYVCHIWKKVLALAQVCCYNEDALIQLRCPVSSFQIHHPSRPWRYLTTPHLNELFQPPLNLHIRISTSKVLTSINTDYLIYGSDQRILSLLMKCESQLLESPDAYFLCFGYLICASRNSNRPGWRRRWLHIWLGTRLLSGFAHEAQGASHTSSGALRAPILSEAGHVDCRNSLSASSQVEVCEPLSRSWRSGLDWFSGTGLWCTNRLVIVDNAEREPIFQRPLDNKGRSRGQWIVIPTSLHTINSLCSRTKKTLLPDLLSRFVLSFGFSRPLVLICLTNAIQRSGCLTALVCPSHCCRKLWPQDPMLGDIRKASLAKSSAQKTVAFLRLP